MCSQTLCQGLLYIHIFNIVFPTINLLLDKTAKDFLIQKYHHFGKTMVTFCLQGDDVSYP